MNHVNHARSLSNRIPLSACRHLTLLGIRPTGKTTSTKKETPRVGRSRTARGSAISFWYCSTISPAFVERVTPVASFPFPLPRHTFVNQTLAIDAPTAFFTRLRCGQALRQASHHAGKEAFENSHCVPHISNSKSRTISRTPRKTSHAWWTRLEGMFASEMTAGRTPRLQWSQPSKTARAPFGTPEPVRLGIVVINLLVEMKIVNHPIYTGRASDSS